MSQQIAKNMSVRDYVIKEVEKRFQELSTKLEDEEKRFRRTVMELEAVSLISRNALYIFLIKCKLRFV